jgi:hypothetical protein
MAEIASAVAAAVEEQGAATGDIARNVEEAAKRNSGSHPGDGRRARGGQRDRRQVPKPRLRLRRPFGSRAVSLKSNVSDFLHTIRTAA